MNRRNVVIIGSSGLGKIALDIFLKQDEYTVVGFIDRFRQVGELELGYPVLGAEEDLPKLAKKHSIYGAVIAIGDNFVRGRVASKVMELCPSILFVNAIHPHTSIAIGVQLGYGVIVMAGAVIGTSVTVGNFCILNSQAFLGHDVSLEHFASLAPKASVGGNSKIGFYSAVGIGATMVQKTTIGEHSIIGAGAVVTKDIDAFTVAYGNPAKIIRTRKKGDKYL